MRRIFKLSDLHTDGEGKRKAILQRAADATVQWGRLNPYWYARAYVELSRNGRVAYCRYSSNQGTSTFAVVR